MKITPLHIIRKKVPMFSSINLNFPAAQHPSSSSSSPKPTTPLPTMCRSRLWWHLPRKYTRAEQTTQDTDEPAVSTAESQHISRSSDCTSLTFPLDKLSTLQRHAWGIPVSATSVIIRLAGNVVDYQKSVGFCIHLTPSDQETDDDRHRYRYTHNAWSNAVICTARPVVLTYVLARELHGLLQKKRKVQDIYDKAHSTINSTRPGSKCVVCRKDFKKGVRLWRPLPCGEDCAEVFGASSIDMRLSVILGDAKAVDLMLSSVYQLAAEHEAAVQTGAADFTARRLPDCPIPLQVLKSVIESFPALSSTTNWFEVLDDSDEGRNRRKLLSWVSDQFSGFLSTTPDSYKVPGCGNTHQFLLANSSLDREVAFSKRVEPHATVFHGTKAPRVFSILTDGLRNLSADTFRLYDYWAKGVYVSSKATFSLNRYTSTFTGWARSQFQAHRILFGCELADRRYTTNHPTPIHSFSQQDRVMIRYVFVVPDSEVNQFRDIGPNLERECKKLHANDIL